MDAPVDETEKYRGILDECVVDLQKLTSEREECMSKIDGNARRSKVIGENPVKIDEIRGKSQCFDKKIHENSKEIAETHENSRNRKEFETNQNRVRFFFFEN